MGHYQPLSWLTLAADHALWGMNPAGYHATNIGLHALTGVAVYFLAWRLLSIRSIARTQASDSQTRLAALAAGLLFAVHPLRCESVAWVTERRDVLSGLFFVLAILAYLKYAAGHHRGSRVGYALAVLFLLLSLLAKAWGIVMPALLVLLDTWPLRRWDRKSWPRVAAEKLPFVLLSCAFLVLARRAQAHAMAPLELHGVADRTMQAMYGLAFYPAKTVVPIGLGPIYEMPYPFVPTAARFVAATVCVIGVTVLLIAMRRRFPTGLAAWAAYAITVSPVLGLAQSGPQLAADRYSYLSCIPLVLLAAGLVMSWSASRGGPRRGIWYGAGALVAVLAVMTARQTRVWHDSASLWEHAYQLDPGSAITCENLGVVRMEQGQATTDPATRQRRYQEAMALLDRSYAIRAKPAALFDLATVHLWQADDDASQRGAHLAQAVTYAQRGLEMAGPEARVRTEWRLNYGIALLKLGRFEEARTEFEWCTTREDAPAEACLNLGSVRILLGKPCDAIAPLRTAADRLPDDARVWLAIGLAHRGCGDSAQAAAAFERVLREVRQRAGPAAGNDANFRAAQAELQTLRGQP